MRKYLVYGVVTVLLIPIVFTLDFESVWFVLASGVVVGLVVVLIDGVVENARHLKLAWQALWSRKSTIRLSVSYLFRIEVDGKYLLVKSNRYDQFQPIGGVYQWNPSAQDRFRRMGVREDNYLPVDDLSRRDLRLRVPGRHLVAFVRWFESERNREIGGWREFEEELIESGILPREPFRSISYDYLGRTYRPLRYSDHAQSKELLIADIYELLPSPEQLSALRDLQSRDEPRVRWASDELIARRGSEARSGPLFTISDHTQWTIGEID